MRTLLLELRPIGLGDVRLADLLKQLAEGISGRIRAQIIVNVDGEAVLPTEVKLAFYRIAQEALNNVVKHSGADKVEIEMKATLAPSSRKSKRKVFNQRTLSDSVSLLIRDNGCGFDPKSVMGEHLGLGIMQERATNTQIILSIRSKPGRGTEVSLHWPKLDH
jgi:signal transduction histidine kinase